LPDIATQIYSTHTKANYSKEREEDNIIQGRRQYYPGKQTILSREAHIFMYKMLVIY
jgi:hypothetical protein